MTFGLLFGVIAGWDFGAEYFAGYIVEKSLSVDNLFVFVVILSTFAVPAEHQHRVLTFGILIALVMRGIFIALGAALIATFSFMFVIFGLLLVYTAIQLFRHRDQDPNVADNPLVRLMRRLLPVTSEYHDGRMLTRLDGRRAATPLFIAFVAIGSSDLLFALDSIPAVFGVTQQQFIVFAANAFALLPARAVLPGHRPARPARLPLRGPVADPGLHRHQAAAALRASAQPRDPRDRHVNIPACGRRRAWDHDRRLAAQGAP